MILDYKSLLPSIYANKQALVQHISSFFLTSSERMHLYKNKNNNISLNNETVSIQNTHSIPHELSFHIRFCQTSLRMPGVLSEPVFWRTKYQIHGQVSINCHQM